MSRHRKLEVLVVGGGPAGIAAAVRAAEAGLQVGIVDDNPSVGGQIWRGEASKQSSSLSGEWFQRFSSNKIELFSGTRIFEIDSEHALAAENASGTYEFHYEKLVLATGARERFLPFPGWTLPNVVGVGALQALAKSGVPIKGRKVVIAGTGPLLLAVGAHLKEYGAEICLIAEQAPIGKLIRFGTALFRTPSKISEGIAFRRRLAGVPIVTNSWPVSVQGSCKLESVTMRSGNKKWQVRCDYLACGFHLVPNTELATLLGCKIEDGVVVVDSLQQTNRDSIYCAGEPTGVGGVELSLVEGEIAGFAIAGKIEAAQRLFPLRTKYRNFAERMERAFALNPKLRDAALPETFICRCEDVSLERLREHSSWRSAKLHTRCGMGPCQGRVCGPALQFLLGWAPESVRPPLSPVRVESLAASVED